MCAAVLYVGWATSGSVNRLGMLVKSGERKIQLKPFNNLNYKISSLQEKKK